MKKGIPTTLAFIFWFVFLASCATTRSATYEETVAKWTSYKDVANWMSENFQYDYQRKLHGWQAYDPEKTFQYGTGVCQDGANFARDALNRINPDYHARIVYIKNKLGRPHHWVTAFTMNNKLYIMDYAAGSRWASMMGVHGPYDSLTEYEKFLSSLHITGFEVEEVLFTNK
jgi:hypothetical protein